MQNIAILKVFIVLTTIVLEIRTTSKSVAKDTAVALERWTAVGEIGA